MYMIINLRMKIVSIPVLYLIVLGAYCISNSDAQQILRGERPYPPLQTQHQHQKYDQPNSNLTLFLDSMYQTENDAQSPVVEDWKVGYKARNSFQTCNSGGEYAVRGLCSSGRYRDCRMGKDLSYQSVGCGKVPTPASPNPEDKADKLVKAGLDQAKPKEDLNGWKCGDHGEILKCDDGEMMIGACGSGARGDCRTYCNQGFFHAIKCADPKPTFGILPGEIRSPQKFGVYFTCKKDEVACGACQSGFNKDCKGQGFFLKCCKVGRFGVVGRWNREFTIPTSTSKLTIEHGTTKTNSETETTKWTNSVTSTVKFELKTPLGKTEDGLNFLAQVEHTVSTEMSTTYKREWSVSTLTRLEIPFEPEQRGMEVWQWVFDIVDAMGNKVTTMTKDFAFTDTSSQKPKCYPGHSKARTVEYQECEPCGYLPAFKDEDTDCPPNMVQEEFAEIVSQGALLTG